eukprot:scaffold14369_cov142-Skeletonema_menzelii.AAC.1
MNTSNLFEPPAPPKAAGNDGVEVPQAFGGNEGGEPEAEAGGGRPLLNFDNDKGESKVVDREGDASINSTNPHQFDSNSSSSSNASSHPSVDCHCQESKS